MSEVSTVGIDLAKSVFQVHGADASGGVVFRKKLRRDQVQPFFSSLPRCVVAMEACASAHYWARELAAVGERAKAVWTQSAISIQASSRDEGFINRPDTRKHLNPRARNSPTPPLHSKGCPHTDGLTTPEGDHSAGL